jgi:hypothetical protein
MATPTQITQTNYGFAPEVAPYAQDLLGQAKALTDVEYNPYMQYQGERQAQFSPLQQQSFNNAALMQTAPQLGDATAMAGTAGLGALNTQYTFNPANFTSANAQALMNPYMQNVVDIQKREAQRQSDIAGTQQQGQATKAGAFGGGRDAIMRAERERNLGMQMNDIQSQGLNNAYNQAMQQFNAQNQLNAQQSQFGAGLGLQGLQTAGTMANTLGQLGNTQYQQNMGINQMQNQYGLQQQQQMQGDINNKYQDYLNAQNYPYKNLSFMSDIIRGVPLTQTGSSIYQAPPSTMQNITSLGLGAAGISKLMANGGVAMSSGGGLGALALNNLV